MNRLKARWMWSVMLVALIVFPIDPSRADGTPVRIGSKAFAESHVLAEVTAQLLESRGVSVERKLGLGGTLIAFEALGAGSIDLYPEYTGTITQVVLGAPRLDAEELSSALSGQGLVAPVSLGFDNSYAIAVAEGTANTLGLEKISDLAAHPALRAGFSHEFLNRADGWKALRLAYRLPQEAVGIEHALAYGAIESGQLDITDAYTTDGELSVRDLRLLQDDLGFFPDYGAVLLARDDLAESVLATLRELEQAIDEVTMRSLNHEVAQGDKSPAEVAAAFLADRDLVRAGATSEPGRPERILGNVAVHLKLTGMALLAACLVALPLAVLASPFNRLSRPLLYLAGLVQTVPALALLALFIPVFGLGELPAILALFLYSLLPIVRNTLTGLFNVDPLVRQVATGMGLTRLQRLRHVELPLAFPAILAGIKTAAIISIGTATLAAFVGAGGLGEPIITGLTLNDHRLILEGAIPAAILAVVVELAFELIERAFIPAHLRD